MFEALPNDVRVELSPMEELSSRAIQILDKVQEVTTQAGSYTLVSATLELNVKENSPEGSELKYAILRKSGVVGLPTKFELEIRPVNLKNRGSIERYEWSLGETETSITTTQPYRRGWIRQIVRFMPVETRDGPYDTDTLIRIDNVLAELARLQGTDLIEFGSLYDPYYSDLVDLGIVDKERAENFRRACLDERNTSDHPNAFELIDDLSRDHDLTLPEAARAVQSRQEWEKFLQDLGSENGEA